MKLWILFLIISYIVGIVGSSIIVIIENDDIETFNDFKKSLIGSPAFIPVVNIFLLVVYIILCIFTLLMFCVCKFCGIEKLWNKINDKK
jgi:hypothetical protein